MIVSAQARDLIALYAGNGSFRNSVDSSPEPYRALIWESRMFPDMDRFDGSRAYHKLVDRIMELWVNNV